MPNSTWGEKFRKKRELSSAPGVVQPLWGMAGHPLLRGSGPREGWSGDDAITARCRTLAVAAPLCPRIDRKSGVGRRLCRGHARGPAAGSIPPRRTPWAAGRAVSAVHPDLELGLDQ